MSLESNPMRGVPADRMVGQVVGRYRLLSRLGSGAMAHVYLAEMTGDGQFQKHVAIKLLRSQPSTGLSGSANLFINEARIGGYLSHENIVQTLDYGTVDGSSYMVMEFVDGPTLAEIIGACRRFHIELPTGISLRILLAVCDALSHAHQAVDHDDVPLRIIHRDVKPSNVILTVSGHVKVADFGIARAESNMERTRTGVIKGTLRFMSPEQARADRDLDGRSDVWSAAVVLFEILSGQSLYSTTNIAHLLRDVQDARIKPLKSLLPPSRVTPEIARLYSLGLAADPAHRFASAAVMAEAVDQALAACGRVPRTSSWMRETEAALAAGLRALGAEAQLEGVAPGGADLWRLAVEYQEVGDSEQARLGRNLAGAQVPAIPLQVAPTSANQRTEALSLDIPIDTAESLEAPPRLDESPTVVVDRERISESHDGVSTVRGEKPPSGGTAAAGRGLGVHDAPREGAVPAVGGARAEPDRGTALAIVGLVGLVLLAAFAYLALQ